MAEWNDQLKEWFINYRVNGGAIRTIIQMTGIPRNSFTRYVTGETTSMKKMSVKNKQALYKLTGLECFQDLEHGTPVEQVSETHPDIIENITTTVNENPSTAINGLAKQVQQLYVQLKKMGASHDLTKEERYEIVGYAIDTLVEQMEHFKGKPQNDRNKLASYLNEHNQVNRYGWADNILRGISRQDNTPEVFARGFPAPKKEDSDL